MDKERYFNNGVIGTILPDLIELYDTESDRFEKYYYKDGILNKMERNYGYVRVLGPTILMVKLQYYDEVVAKLRTYDKYENV